MFYRYLTARGASSRFAFHALLLIVTLFACRANAIEGNARKLPSAAAAIAARLQPLGVLPPTRQLQLAITLPSRDPHTLSGLVKRLQDPASPSFHQYLTPAQFAAQFGPAPADYARVVAFALAHHLAVTAVHANRLVLDVQGSAADIQSAFHVVLRTYRHPTEARTFFAPDAAPSVDPALPISGVEGLDSYGQPVPQIHIRPDAAITSIPGTGSGPHGSYIGRDLRAAYAPGSTLTGAGQTVALVEFDGYHATDIQTYERTMGRLPVKLENVLLDGFDGKPTSDEKASEVCLDIEMVIAMAPGVSKIVVYEAGPDGNWDDVISRAASDGALQISCSWTNPEKPDDSTADSLFIQLAAQGQSFFNASGDTGAYSGLMPFPADNPYITEVGGTTLSTGGPARAYVSETAWNSGLAAATSGGVSTQYSIPTWQQGINMGLPGGSTSQRNTPDVAAAAANICIVEGGRSHIIDGTSCAAPIWAAFMALVNQQSKAHGAAAAGFINPVIYALASGPTYSVAFHDITLGNNYAGNSAIFTAATGYDLCTGLGSPNGSTLIDLLAGSGDPLAISPFAVTATSVSHHRPASVTYQLTNTGTNALLWHAAAEHTWMTFKPASGFIAGGGSTIITGSFSSAISDVADGTYQNTVTFTDDITGIRQARPLALTISPPVAKLDIAGSSDATFQGSVGGPFLPSSATYFLSNSGNSPLHWSATSAASWFSLSSSTGTLEAGDTTAVVLNLTTAANSLPQGSYRANITFSNLSGGVGSSIYAATLEVIPPPPIITSSTTAAALQGNPLSYQITATNNPSGYFTDNLPAGLSVDSVTGLISGSAADSGTFAATIGASNAGGSGTSALVITVSPSPPVITSSSTASAVFGAPFAFQVAASNDPTLFSASGLPTGLTIDPTTGLITGSVIAPGTGNLVASLTVFASNAAGSGSANLILTFTQTPAITAFYYTSSSSAYVGGGGSGSYTNGNGFTLGESISSGSNVFAVSVDSSDFSTDWTVNLSAPSGQVFAPGTYQNATRYPFQASGSPGLSFYGDGRGDNTSTGTYTILQIAYNPDGSLATFAADFVQFDEFNLSAWNIGSIRYNSTIPLTYLPLAAVDSTAATGLSSSSEILTGSIDPKGLAGTCNILYGPTPAYGFTATTPAISPVPADVVLSATLANLTAGSPYHYKWVVTTSAGVTSGSDATFTVLARTPNAPAITSGTFVLAQDGQAFFYQIVASNSPNSFSTAGLPSGLSLDTNTGIISGTPTSSGDNYVTIQATNGGGTGSASLEIEILPYPPQISSAGQANGLQGQPFSYQISASNSPTAYGADGLPTGLSINTSTGIISGTASDIGTTYCTVSAINLGGTATLDLAISIVATPTITSTTSATVTQGQPFSYQITALGNPTSYSATNLPAGLSCNDTSGLISGAPTYGGFVDITLTAYNSGGSSNATLGLNVIAAAPSITSTTPILAGVNIPILPYPVTATNFPTSFAASGLPPGFTINSTSGAITGTATSTGTTSVILSAGNAVGTGTASVPFIISATQPPITAFYYSCSSSAYVGHAGTPGLYYSETGATISDFGATAGTYLEFYISGPAGSWWYIDFETPQPITTGTFLNATRWPFQAVGTNGLSFDGNGAGDNQLTGSFIIREATFNPDSTYHSFAADFIQYDENNTAAWNVGSIRLSSTIPILYATGPTINTVPAVSASPAIAEHSVARPALAAPSSDSSGSGNAIFINPASAHCVVQILSIGGKPHVTLAYTASDPASIYTPEVSSDLHDWISGPNAVAPLTSDTSAHTQTVFDCTPTSTTAPRYIRLRVNTP